MYLTLNENSTRLTISDSSDLSDYDTQRIIYGVEDVIELVSTLGDFVKLMQVDEVAVKRNELLRLKPDIEKQLSELGE
jgi:hypothetical protein